jgi:hypothetical protein
MKEREGLESKGDEIYTTWLVEVEERHCCGNSNEKNSN